MGRVPGVEGVVRMRGQGLGRCGSRGWAGCWAPEPSQRRSISPTEGKASRSRRSEESASDADAGRHSINSSWCREDGAHYPASRAETEPGGCGAGGAAPGGAEPAALPRISSPPRGRAASQAGCGGAPRGRAVARLRGLEAEQGRPPRLTRAGPGFFPSGFQTPKLSDPLSSRVRGLRGPGSPARARRRHGPGFPCGLCLHPTPGCSSGHFICTRIVGRWVIGR